MTDPIDGVRRWLDDLAAPVPAPGGGAAAAMTVAVAASVTAMAVGYAPAGDARDGAARVVDAAREAAMRAQIRDAAASARLIAAFRGGTDDLADALVEATDASLAIVDTAAPLLDVLRWLRTHGDPRLRSDVAVGGHLAAGAIRAAAVTAAQNLESWPDAPPRMHDRLAGAEPLADAMDGVTH